jgi:ribosomal protein S18 acetylase RimI-like enzyme
MSGEQIVGIGACFSGNVALSFTLAAARQILSFYGLLQGWAVIRKGLQMEHIVQPPTGRLHYLAHLGVAPDWQGKGVGAQLIQHLLKQGQQAGRRTAALDVAVTNPRAQALYERLGFVVTHERSSTLANVAHHRRMEKGL